MADFRHVRATKSQSVRDLKAKVCANAESLYPAVSYLVGPPGVGKTKTLFDFSRKRYTLYLSCPTPQVSGDSLDLQALFSFLREVPLELLQKVPYNETMDFHFLFSLLVFSRLLYLNELMKRGVSPEVWLLIQTTENPHKMNLMELFQFVVSATRHYPGWQDDVGEQIKVFRSTISSSGERIVLCLDESQYLFAHFDGMSACLPSPH